MLRQHGSPRAENALLAAFEGPTARGDDALYYHFARALLQGAAWRIGERERARIMPLCRHEDCWGLAHPDGDREIAVLLPSFERPDITFQFEAAVLSREILQQ